MRFGGGDMGEESESGTFHTFSFKRASETGLLGRAATGGGIEVSGILSRVLLLRSN